MRAVILGAGFGSRLGKPLPKPLTVLSNGETIMERQVSALTEFLAADDVIVVVGFKKESIMKAFSNLTYVFNDVFAETNTAKSLLCGLRKTGSEDVMWLNGDVI
ncbi:MAG: NTP transferase domain-containing protein, partial [Chloroflexi bacterium]|nr:NTP transferase domain-containing protein [Chloroflexota bacterium]